MYEYCYFHGRTRSGDIVDITVFTTVTLFDSETPVFCYVMTDPPEYCKLLSSMYDAHVL